MRLPGLPPSRREQIEIIVQKVKDDAARQYVQGFTDGMDAILDSLGEVLLIVSESGMPERDFVELMSQWRDGVRAKVQELPAQVEAEIARRG